MSKYYTPFVHDWLPERTVKRVKIEALSEKNIIQTKKKKRASQYRKIDMNVRPLLRRKSENKINRRT